MPAEYLWAICLVLFYWISRVLLLTHRGEMHDGRAVDLRHLASRHLRHRRRGALSRQAQADPVGLRRVGAGRARNPEAASLVMRSNYIGPAAILGEAANRMVARGTGVIVGISSVAGERGRARNYVYGSAKAGFTAFLSGLRNRLHGTGVRVITVLPGYVATRMTESMLTPSLLTAQPDEVAAAVLAAERQRRDVVYVRPIWRLVMAVIRAIPEPMFKRLHI